MDYHKETEKFTHEILKLLDGVNFIVCAASLSLVIAYLFEYCGPNDEEIDKVFNLFLNETKKNREKMKDVIKNKSPDDGKTTLLQR
jgi:hypothetical protein